MKPVKFNEHEDYQFMEVLGVKGVFTPVRIERDTLPPDFHKYALRDGEEEFISQIANEVMVNHAGDLITKEPIDLGSDGFKNLSSEDWSFCSEAFDFEQYFGCKLTIDYQIDRAESKRAEQLGNVPKDRNQAKNSPPGRDNHESELHLN